MKTKQPPFTLEQAAKELLVLEDIATLARDQLSATHWILGNLLMTLDQQGTINGPSFIADLQAVVDQIPADNERVAAEVVCNELMQQMLAYRLPSSGHGH